MNNPPNPSMRRCVRWACLTGIAVALATHACNLPEPIATEEQGTASGNNNPPTWNENAESHFGGFAFECTPDAAQGHSITDEPLPNPSSIGSDEDDDSISYQLAKLDGSEEPNFTVSEHNHILVKVTDLNLSASAPYLFELHLFDGKDLSIGSFTVVVEVDATRNNAPFFVAAAGRTFPIPDNEPIHLGSFEEGNYSPANPLILGDIHAFDADRTDVLTYTVTSTSQPFSTSSLAFRGTGLNPANTRTRKLEFRTTLDYETEAHRTNHIDIRISDNDNATDTIRVVFEVTDVEE